MTPLDIPEWTSLSVSEKNKKRSMRRQKETKNDHDAANNNVYYKGTAADVQEIL